MAINKKLITFTKKSVFLGDKGIKGQTTPTNGYYGNIPATSIVFILDTGELWTHGKYISGGVWGEKNANYIPLNIRGTSYNLSLDGHTHSQYLTLHQDLSAYAKLSWVSDNFSASGHTHTTLASLGDNTSINATNYSSGFTPKPYYGISPSTGTAPSTYGNILEYVSNNKGGGQLAMEWTGSQTNTNGTDTNVGRLYYRSKRDCIGGWTTWKTVAWTTDIPTTLKNPKALTTFGVAYDGSEAKTVTTATFISQLSEGTSNVTDGTMFVTSWASDNGFADTNAVNTPYKRKASCLYNYIKSKTDNLYAAKGHTHDGRYLRWAGSSADTSAMNWGTLTTANGYTILSHASSAEGGDIGWVCKGGQIFQQLDGYYYQNGGKYRVLDTSDSSSFAAASHTHDGRYVYNYGGTNCGTAGLGGNYMGMTTGSGISSDWWHILSAAWNSEYRWNSQIAFPTQNRSTMYFRSGKDDNSGWGEWKRLALYSDIPSTLKNPKALTIQTNGTSLGSYDGAEAKTWNITYSNVGAAAASHTHNYLPLSGGTMNGTAYITFADSGSWGAGTGAQGARGGIKWSGLSDYAYLYAEETAGDNLDLVLKFGDDNSNGFSIRNASGSQTAYISAKGVITASSFVGTATGNLTSISYDSTNKKLQQTKNGTTTDVVTFGSNAFNSTAYLPLSGGTLTGQLYINRGNTSTPSLRWNKTGSYWGGIGYGGTSNENVFGAVDSSGNWVNGSVDVWNFKGADLRLNGTSVSLSGHTHSYLPLTGGTLTGNLNFLFNGDSTLRIYGAAGGNDEKVYMLTGIDNRLDDYDIPSYGGAGRHRLILQPRGGRVGIGDSNPAYTLEVGGDCRISSNLLIATTNTSYTLSVGGTVFSTGSPGFYNKVSSGNWSFLRLHNSNNFWDLATNANSNSGALELRYNGGETAKTIINTNGTISIIANGVTTKIGALNSDWTHYTTTTKHWFNTNVYVNGTLYYYPNNSYYWNGDAGYSSTYYTNNWFRSIGATGWYSQTYGGGWYMTDSTWIRNFGSKAVYLDANLCVDAKVGIGTTSPTQKLHVAGYTLATGFIRNGSNDSYVLTGGGGHKKWTTGNTANALVARDGNGYMYSSYINTAINAEDSGTVNYIYYSYDNWIRKMSYNRLKNILNSDLSFVKWSSYRKNSSTTIKTIENVFAPAVGTSDNRIHIGAMSSINNDYDDWKFGLGSFIKIDPKTSGGNISICANNSVGIIGNGVNINAYSSELNLMSSSIHAITSGIKGLFLTSNYGLHSGTNKLVLPSGDTRAYILARNGFAIEVGATPASNYSCDDHPSSPAYSSLYLDSGMTFVGVGNGLRNGMVAESGVVRMRVKDKSVLKLQENAVTTFTNTYIGESGNSTSLSVYGTVYSAGFSKSGSNDNYVLTGGGGHTAISNLNVGQVDGYHISVVNTLPSNPNSSTLYFIY